MFFLGKSPSQFFNEETDVQTARENTKIFTFYSKKQVLDKFSVGKFYVQQLFSFCQDAWKWKLGKFIREKLCCSSQLLLETW